jgi:hypothetical protein
VRLLACAGGFAVAFAALAASAGSLQAMQSPICTHGLTYLERDPRGLLPLGADPISPSAAAAFRFGGSKGRPLVTRAMPATADHGRGRALKYECNNRVWHRTVVVYVTLRAALRSSASIAEEVFYVGRFRGGYRVWQVVH